MTYEARIAFVLFFFVVWLFFGLLTWAVVAVVRRGRGALLALPLALSAAAAAGVMVPLLGWRDAVGFAVSLGAATAGALAGAIAGVVFAERMGMTPPRPDAARRPEREGEEPARSEPP